MTYAAPRRQFGEGALPLRSLAIEGWRGINHSFALVNQNQILELLKLDGLRLYHRDLPFAFSTWTRAANPSGLPEDQQRLVDALPSPGSDPVDCIYRIGSPFRAGPNDVQSKTVTFMVMEFGLTPGSFEGGIGDPALFTRRDDTIVTPSRWSRDRLLDWGFPDGKVEVIPHGVDGTVFAPLPPEDRQVRRRALGLADDETVYLNVGLPTWNKGLDLLLVAFATLRAAGRKVRLILKDQRDLYGCSVENLIKTVGVGCPALLAADTLGAIAVVPTNLGTADLRALFAAADAYVSPYRAEGFNLPVLEAIACGTPVIVTRGGATDDFCDDGVALRIRGTAGSLAQEGAAPAGRFIEADLPELVEAMDAFTGGKGAGLASFREARSAVVARFTWSEAAKQLASLTVGLDTLPRDPEPPAGLAPRPAPLVLRAAEQSGTSDVLVNIAPGGAASQSSHSRWSSPEEAGRAISGRIEDDFAFHTDDEIMPWWHLDLGAAHPIEAIVVHNRVSGFHDRARSLKVEIAEHAGRWILIHKGHALFGSAFDGRPLVLRIGSGLRARFVRLSLEDRQPLHLSQVEVLARRDLLAFDDFRQCHGLAALLPTSTDFGRPYGIEIPEGARSGAIVGLKTSYSSRFGNLLQQYTHMILIARATGLRFIQLGHHELLGLQHPVEVDGITLLPWDASLPDDGVFLTGSFFDSSPFAPILRPFLHFGAEEEAAHSDVARRYLRPHLLAGLPVPGERHVDDELTIHIRSGDIFVGDQAGNRAYRQPPLSFYTLVIGRMRAEGRIARVRLVFEDRGNPCIDALEAWLGERAIPVRVQCGTLRDDMSALLDAPHLVFGYGTFGYAVCRLSRRIETVHFFKPELGGCYAHIPSIARVFAVSDEDGAYIQAGEVGVASGAWDNSPEQRETMLTYPESALSIETVGGDPSSTSSPAPE